MKALRAYNLSDQYAKAVRDWPEVLACHALTGEMDYLLRVQVEDLDHFSRFVMDSLLKHPGVLDVKSSAWNPTRSITGAICRICAVFRPVAPHKLWLPSRMDTSTSLM